MKKLAVLLFAVVLQIVDSSMVVNKKEKCDGNLLGDYKNCQELSTEALTKILGMAYNQRYMKIELPSDEIKTVKRNSLGNSNFYLPSNYVRELFPEIDDSDKQLLKRENEDNNQTLLATKRATISIDTPKIGKQGWDCNATPKWIDLGEDYFPRYMKIAECGNEKCWYGQYYCVQNSFTVFILRKSNQCKSAQNSKKNLKRYTQWVWVERALPFMCDCVEAL